MLTPTVLIGLRARLGSDPVRFSEMQYARFCRELERACTAEVLEALRGYADPLEVFVCGQAAFMQGERHLQHLRKLPGHVRVHFPGHVTGMRKAAFFRMADLYVFPSRDESYGLTLLEALYAGLPAVCFTRARAISSMKPSDDWFAISKNFPSRFADYAGQAAAGAHGGGRLRVRTKAFFSRGKDRIAELVQT